MEYINLENDDNLQDDVVTIKEYEELYNLNEKDIFKDILEFNESIKDTQFSSFDIYKSNIDIYKSSSEQDEIYKYLTTGKDNLDEMLIDFDYIPEIEDINDDENVSLCSTLHNFLLKFRDLLIKLQSTKHLYDGKLEFIHFPYIYTNKRKSKHVNKISINLQQKMAPIHRIVAEGRINEALKLCLEKIVEDPKNIEAYRVLSLLYGEMGDMKNCLKFSLTCAVLNKSDSYKWHTLAMNLLKAGESERAIRCLQNALTKNPKYIPSFWELSSRLLINKEYIKLFSSLLCFYKYAIVNDIDDSINGFKELISIISIHHNMNLVKHVEVFLKNILPIFDLELFSMYSNLINIDSFSQDYFKTFVSIHKIPYHLVDTFPYSQITQQQFDDIFSLINFLPLNILIKFACSLIIILPDSAFLRYFITTVNIDDLNRIELLRYFVKIDYYEYSLINLKPSIDLLCQDNVIRYSFVKYFIEIKDYQYALKLTTYIGINANCSFTDILSAFICIYSGNLYGNIIPYFFSFFDTSILEQQCLPLILNLINTITDYIKIENYIDYDFYDFIIISFLILNMLHKLHLNNIESMLIQSLENITKRYVNISLDLTVKILKCVKNYCDEEQDDKYNLYHKLSVHARILHISSLLYLKQYDSAYSYLCEMLQCDVYRYLLYNKNFCNLISFILTRCENVRHHRISKIFNKYQLEYNVSHYLIMAYIKSISLNATNFFKFTQKSIDVCSDEYFPYLVHANCILDVSLNSKIKEASTPAIQSFMYMLIYFNKRGAHDSIEACYNLGRFFHILGFYTYAVKMYNIALNLCKESSTSELLYEIAYNLALIYDNSGNRQLANSILRLYLTF